MEEREELKTLLGLLQAENSTHWKCPICKADNLYQKKQGNEIYCSACNGYYPLSDLKEGAGIQFIDDFKEHYELLQAGEFSEVSEWCAEKQTEDSYASNREFLQYLKFRADFKILGPLITPEGKNTEIFTPCVIEKFQRGKIEIDSDFQALRRREILVSKKAILDSTDRYTAAPDGTKTFDYDIFICHKTDDGGFENTPDYRIGKRMYTLLTKRGYKVFFAPETKKELPATDRIINVYASDWRQWIYDAIITSELMIVIGTKKEYILSPNVQNEWATFKEFCRSGYYGHKRMMFVTKEYYPELYFGEYESYYPKFITRGKLNGKAFLEAITGLDYRKSGTEEALIQNPGRGYIRSDEEAEVQKMKSRFADPESNPVQLLEHAQEIASRYSNRDAFIHVALVNIRLAEKRCDGFEREERAEYYREAYRWLCRIDDARANAYRAFCLYNGYGTEENKEEAFRLLQGNADEVGRYYYSLFTLLEHLSGGSVSEQSYDRALNNIKRYRNSFPEMKALYDQCVEHGLIKRNRGD